MDLRKCDRCEQEHLLELLTISSSVKSTNLNLCENCMSIARSMWKQFMKPIEDRLTDDSIMPMSKEHKGKRLGDVPSSFWTWFLTQPWCDKWPKLVEYANHVEGK